MDADAILERLKREAKDLSIKFGAQDEYALGYRSAVEMLEILLKEDDEEDYDDVE